VADETPIIELRDISKSFGSVQALTDVDLSVPVARWWRSS